LLIEVRTQEAESRLESRYGMCCVCVLERERGRKREREREREKGGEIQHKETEDRLD
jgi:hypothetical protein